MLTGDANGNGNGNAYTNESVQYTNDVVRDESGNPVLIKVVDPR